MDRRVKERLIGATILVALIVLIVPELLSGPKPAPLPPLAAGLPGTTRNVSVNLATSRATPEPQTNDAGASSAASNGTSASSASAATPSDGAQAAQAVEGAGRDSDGASNTPASGAPTVTTLRAQSAAPLENSNSPPRSAGESVRAADSARTAAPEGQEGAPSRRGWAVQLGVFASKVNAERLLHQLPGNGFYVVSSGTGSSLRYRVRLGPLADRNAAERAVTRLKALGHPATIVTPAS
jgi:DedD protein